MLSYKKISFIILSSSCLLVACSKQQAVKTDTASASLSPACAEYVQTLKKLSAEDEKLKDMMANNLEKIDEEWQTLTSKEQEDFTKQCENMNKAMADLQKMLNANG